MLTRQDERAVLAEPELHVPRRWSRPIDWAYSSTLGITLAATLALVLWSRGVPVAAEMRTEEIPDRFARAFLPDFHAGEPAAPEPARIIMPAPEKKPAQPRPEPPRLATGRAEGSRSRPETSTTMDAKISGRGLVALLGTKGNQAVPGSAVADVLGAGLPDTQSSEIFRGLGSVAIASTTALPRGSSTVDAATPVGPEQLGTGGIVGRAGHMAGKVSEATIAAKVTAAEPLGPVPGSRNGISSVVRQRLSAIRHCYEWRLKLFPELHGRVVVRFVIHPGGAVIAVETAENTTGDPLVSSCINAVVGSLRFTPTSTGETEVTIPFILAPGD